jgi:NADPH-dependent 2,4-dienoyl-CoA reductase/sulfur reductase-like enzyme
LKPASKKRKVIVVGAGPAGFEAALRASERGTMFFSMKKVIQLEAV